MVSTNIWAPAEKGQINVLVNGVTKAGFLDGESRTINYPGQGTSRGFSFQYPIRLNRNDKIMLRNMYQESIFISTTSPFSYMVYFIH